MINLVTWCTDFLYFSRKWNHTAIMHFQMQQMYCILNTVLLQTLLRAWYPDAACPTASKSSPRSEAACPVRTEESLSCEILHLCWLENFGRKALSLCFILSPFLSLVVWNLEESQASRQSLQPLTNFCLRAGEARIDTRVCAQWTHLGWAWLSPWACQRAAPVNGNRTPGLAALS